ncbi:MAG: type IV secretory system conjugative DNA transfer family protein, partial [Gaiellaceae bacterium]
MDALIVAASAGASVATGIGAGALIAKLNAKDGKRPLSTVELRFGTDLDREAVEAVLTAVSGLPRRASVSLETVANEDGIRHFLSGEQAPLDNVSGQLRGLIPDIRIEPIATPDRPVWILGARLSWPSQHLLLRTDGADEAATGLLAALGPLAKDEVLLIRVELRPGWPAPLPERNGSSNRQRQPSFPFSLFAVDRQVDGDQVRAIRSKYAGPLLHSRLTVAVACGHPKRAEHLLSRVISVVRTRRGSRGTLRIRRLSTRALERGLERRSAGGDLLSPPELSGLIGWPIGAPRLPGLSLGSAPLLIPDRRIPTGGRILGLSTWPGMEKRSLVQPVVGACSHTLLAGPTGSGKSALIERLVVSDLEEGRGCLVLDGKGDLADDLLARIPENRIGDVIVLDPAAGGPVPGLRVFGKTTDPELAADLVLNVLREIFRDSWGVRSEQWLRAGLVTVAHDPRGSTLGDLPYVFSDDSYRRRLVAKLDDPMLRATWAAFEAMNPRERANQLGAPLNKLSELLGRRVLRGVLSQTSPTLDMVEVINKGKVVIVSLSPGRIGAPAARLLGALVVYQLVSAIQARSATPPHRRKPFLAYIDEPKVFGDIPVPIDSIFELARGLGVGLAITAQSPAQLPTPVRNAALSNAATLLVFRQNHDEDAELLARHLSGVSADGLLNLGAFEMIARIGLGPGEVSAPASGRTLPPPAETSDPAQVRRTSAERYGRDLAEVDRALAE